MTWRGNCIGLRLMLLTLTKPALVQLLPDLALRLCQQPWQNNPCRLMPLWWHSLPQSPNHLQNPVVRVHQVQWRCMNTKCNLDHCHQPLVSLVQYDQVWLLDPNHGRLSPHQSPEVPEVQETSLL